jgi:hypothetical protein
MATNNDILFKVARGIAATGADLSYAHLRFDSGVDFAALRDFVRAELAGDDPYDDRHLVDEGVVSCVVQMLAAAMCAQAETDARIAAASATTEAA